MGCGPWGLMVLDRIIERWRAPEPGIPRLEISVVEPSRPGGGVYRGTPEYLLLNTAAGDIDILGGAATGAAGAYTFLEFLHHREYRVSGVRAPESRDYLPRVWLSDYLEWTYDALVDDLPDGVTVTHVPERVLTMDAQPSGVALALSGGAVLRSDFVFITVGVPPARLDLSLAGPGEPVILAGMGLTAIDAIIELTVGRGGRFEASDASGELVYHRSGAEPVIHQFSRNGFFPLCRPTAPLRDLEGWDATLQVPAAEEGARSVELLTAVLPALMTKMAEAECWDAAEPTECAATAASPRLLHDDIERAPTLHESSEAYEASVRDTLAADLMECSLPVLPPRRRGIESMKLLRDEVRRLCDFDRLAPESHVALLRSVLPLFYRYTVGPPASRGQELLALQRSGVLRHTVGPSPRVERGSAGFRVVSTTLRKPAAVAAELYYDAFLPSPGTGELPGFLADAVRRGQACVRLSAGRPVGIAVDSRFHPKGPEGGVTDNVFYLGGLTEGSRHFNFYIPSPGFRARAYTDADRCVDDVMASLLTEARSA
ncbi:FAD/NAD(P)-binding protein [Cellulomonas cellasea]|uniref:FAD/NAD(P)-binding protein n=1 Tax=Cellulomonas cellasea TaxID=43670 RepID=UPI0024AE147B|nr:FAD/NAD(P)-binding protein [Cellulomonas cellasea]